MCEKKAADILALSEERMFLSVRFYGLQEIKEIFWNKPIQTLSKGNFPIH